MLGSVRGALGNQRPYRDRYPDEQVIAAFAIKEDIYVQDTSIPNSSRLGS